MTTKNPFGGFVHTSPLSSLPHDPAITLASNCLRDNFGPTVQTVADCLQRRGGFSSLNQIVASIRNQCRRDWNAERERLVGLLIESSTTKGEYRAHRARGPEQSGHVVDIEPIRAALLVLLQHSLIAVKVTEKNNNNKEARSKHAAGKKRKHTQNNNLTYSYSFNENRARLLPRYPKYVEYAKKTVDEEGAAVVEELLVHGRMLAPHVIASTIETLLSKQTEELSETKKDELLKKVVDSLVRMVDGGYMEQVMPLAPEKEQEEFEFQDGDEPARKKQRTSSDSAAEIAATTAIHEGDYDDKILAFLNSPQYLKHLTPGAVWRVNVDMFHDSLRAFCLGRLVAERYGHKVQSGGSMVTAALRYCAHQQHAVKQSTGTSATRQVFEDDRGVFTAKDIIPYLPAPIQKMLESKPGGAIRNLSKALLELTTFTWPTVLMEIEEAEGHPEGGKFQVATVQLVQHLKGRIFHQVVLDSQGEVAARICSYLQAQGHQESDAIAEAAMVPAKDVREVLHRLYRANIINLLSLQQSKQHNPANAVYLWSVDRSRMTKTITNNVMTALFRIRLRRQHEMDVVGKDWIERAKEAEVDENEHELDKANYQKFCKGLERLDNAALQLDETLMVLKDF